jgi:hypothetical protein
LKHSLFLLVFSKRTHLLVQYEYTATIAQLHRAEDGDILTTRGVDHSELIDSRETITQASRCNEDGHDHPFVSLL